MSARDLDPVVWAAAYGTTYATQAEAVRLAGAEGNAFGINVERCRQVADDAVLSLHPEGLRPPLPLPEGRAMAHATGATTAVWRRVAEHAAATIGAACEHGTCEDAPGSGAPRPAVARVDGVNFCERHAPRESDFELARALLALLDRAG